MKLAKREIDSLACRPGERDRIVFDDAIPGFGLRVTDKGAKIFIFQYQHGGRGGRRERMVLGHYGEITPARARQMAEKARGALREGRNPAEERRAAAEAAARAAEAATYTFAALIDDWAATALTGRSPRYRVEAPTVIRRTFAPLLGRPAHALDRREVRKVAEQAAAQFPIGTRRASSYARAAVNWAIEDRELPATSNPFQKLARGKEDSRDRVLSDAELGEAWRAAAALAPPFGPYIQLLILTLQRRSELAGMRWDELSADFSTWTVPAERAKNDLAHIVHLTAAAREVLGRLPRGAGASLVFAAVRQRARPAPAGREGAPRPISGFSDAKERLADKIRAERARRAGIPLAKATLPDWRWHDFRRTGVTVLARLGVAPHVADRILNHVHGQGAIQGVAAVYQRYEFLPERKAAMALWSAHVLATAAADSAAKVVTLRRE